MGKVQKNNFSYGYLSVIQYSFFLSSPFLPRFKTVLIFLLMEIMYEAAVPRIMMFIKYQLLVTTEQNVVQGHALVIQQNKSKSFVCFGYV